MTILVGGIPYLVQNKNTNIEIVVIDKRNDKTKYIKTNGSLLKANPNLFITIYF